MRKTFIAALLACTVATGIFIAQGGRNDHPDRIYDPVLEQQKLQMSHLMTKEELHQYFSDSQSGLYLASRAAQHRNQWHNAAQFLERSLEGKAKNITELEEASDAQGDAIPSTPAEKATVELQLRLMIFWIGAGQMEKAFELAEELHQYRAGNPAYDPNINQEQLSFATIALIVRDLSQERYNEAAFLIDSLNDDSLAAMLKQTLSLWQKAGSDPEFVIKSRHRNFYPDALDMMHRAYAFEILGRYEDSEEALDRAAVLGETMNIYVARIMFHIRRGNLEDALEETLHLQKENPELEAITLLREEIEALQEGNIQAEDMTGFRQYSYHIGGIRSGLAVSMFDLATLHYVDKSFEAALLMGRIAFFLDPSIEQNAFLISEILAERESYNEALIPLESIIKQNKMFRDSVIQRSDILERAGRHAEAVEVLEAELKRKPHSRIAFNLAEMYRMDELYDEALSTYNQAEFLGAEEGGLPDALWSLYYFRGITHHQLDNWPKAEEDFLQALELRPENPFVLNYLGYSWVDQEMHVKRALTMLEKALQIMPQSGHITDSVGWAYFKLGDFDMAVYYLERASELMPYDAEVNNHLGDAYWALGRHFEARYQWKRAINYAEEDRATHLEIVESASKKLKYGLPKEDIPKPFEDISEDDGENDLVMDDQSESEEGHNASSSDQSDSE